MSYRLTINMIAVFESEATGVMESGDAGSVVATELRRDGAWAGFVVRTPDAVYQDRLIKMGWQPAASYSFSG